VQVPLLATKQYADAGAVSLYWPKIATEVAKLAEENENIGKLIDPLMQIGPYSALIAAILPFVLQIGVNHGRFAPGSMGTVPASTLQAQIEASIAEGELENLRIQVQAEQASAVLRAEIAESRKAMADAMSDVRQEAASD
jgi:hypothetical protein